MPTYNEDMSGGIIATDPFGGGASPCFVTYSPRAASAIHEVGIVQIPKIAKTATGTKIDRLSMESIGLRNWWSFSKPGGVSVYDDARGQTATIRSTDPDLNWVEDATRGGHVFQTDGTDYIETSEATAFNGASEATFSFWVNMATLASNHCFISKNSGTANNGFRIGWVAGQGFAIDIPTGAANARGVVNLSPFSADTWYHVCVVFNGSLPNNATRLRVFVNGTLRTMAFTGTIPATITGNASNVELGRVGTTLLNGKLDDVRFYSYGFRDSRVLAHYHNIRKSSNWEPQTILTVQETFEVLGAAASGEALPAGFVYELPTSGGIRGSGTATNFITVPMSGGSIVAGESQVLYEPLPMTGGIGASGTARITTRVNEPVSGVVIKGVKASGGIDLNKSKDLKYVGVGSGLVLGGAKAGVTSVRLQAQGGITLSSPDDTADTNLTFVKTFRFAWNVRQKIERDWTFLWNLGRLQMFWYRIVSKGVDGNGCPIQGSDCCQKYVVNIHARTLGELCEKLSKRKFKFPIESVQKFSRPAENAAVAEGEANGINYDCQQLIPVEICGIPQCADFCIDYDLTETIGFGTFVQIDSFIHYEMSGSAFYGGTAGTAYYRNLPGFSHDEVGVITVGSETTYTPSNFTMRGGLGAGGSAKVETSRYTYTGGVWPDITEERFGTSNENKVVQTGDVAWSLPERVNKDDSLFAQTDISFGKKSQALITTSFGLNVPSWASVLGLYVKLDRIASQSGVRDLEIYLVRNGEKISDNLADTGNDWPMILTEKTYGSNGLDGRTPWRNPNDDHYAGELTPDDLNDPTFGVLIRTRSRLSLPSQLAKINFISVEGYYEDADGSIVRTGGEARASGVQYHYASTGKTVLHSAVVLKQGHRYRSTGRLQNNTSAVQVTGHSPITFYEVMRGGLVASGDPKVTPYFEEMTGGAWAKPEAKVTPYFEEMTGGAWAKPSSSRSVKITYTGDGEITLGSMSFVPEKQYKYIATGGPSLGSNNRIRSNFWKFNTDGNVAFIFGGADQKASDIGTPVQEMEFGMSVLQTTASFLNDFDRRDAVALSGTVQKCGCDNLPLTVELSHNIARDNLLAMFLVRNSYPVPRALKMRYNETNDSWQCNLHYRGLSAETSTPESWDMIFELQCTDVLGGIGIGRSIWKLAIQIFKKNLTTREGFETRVVVSVLPDAICASQTSQLDFNIVYDTQLGAAVVSPSATVYQNTIYDNIGLFKNRAWIDSPDLTLQVAQSGSARAVQRVDLTKAILVS